MNRRTLHVLLLLLLGVVAVFWLDSAPGPATNPSAAPARDASEQEVGTAKPPQSREPDVASPGAADTAAPTTPLAKGAADPARYRRAYLLNLDGGTLTLAGRQDVEGDFAPPREQAAELWPGMLRCRLVSASGAILAEELMPAPDQLCTVQDRGRPVAYRPAGPVMFQARLPRVADAARLEVSRVAARDATTPDLPIGSIPLPP